MNKLPVYCQGNNSKRYDGKVWLEALENVVEVNGQEVSETLLLSAFKNGDLVKLRERLKNGKVRFWNGVVVLETPSTKSQPRTSEHASKPQASKRRLNEPKPKLDNSKRPKLVKSDVKVTKKAKVGEFY